ncbi:MAG: class I tRNA ligase family protein [candidate division SR1 bacterium]|nr:class I tRNA ligase family protein [candidate division SR1 bacterium]
MDFPKKYTHQSIQQELLTRQKRNKLFGSKAIKKAGEKGTITLLSGPILVAPTTTSYSQLLQTIKEDCMARYFRMLGKQANYSPRFGYQTGNNQGDEKKHNNTQRSKDIEKQKNKRIRQMIWLGIGFDEKECLSLLSPITTRKLRNTIDYYMQEGWIKDDMAINYRSNQRQTNISPEEIARKKIKGKIYNIRYFVDTKNITIVVGTNSPETIFGDVALAVHPEDKRYKKLIGHKVIIPVINKTIPVIGDETIDITKNNGVMRVSPCHDTRGLQIAQKHNLKTNTFAIDHNGCFTKLAGDFGEKKVADFLGNILQNLEDIHNLESVHQEEFEIPTDKTSGEKLQAILSQQRFFVVPENVTQSTGEETMLQSINIQPTMYHDLREKTADNQTNIHWPISQKDSIGIALPVWENAEDSYFVGEYDIINASGRKAKGKKIIPTLLLFNLIADNQLPTLFNIENLIELMLSPGTEGQNIGEMYMQAFEEELPRGYKSEINEFIKLFEYAETDLIKGKSLTNYEKFSIQLTDILDKTFGVVNKKGGRYYFDVAAIMGSKEELIASTEKCESSLATSILLLQQSGILDALQAERTIFLGTEKEKNTIIKTNILGKLKTGHAPLQDIFLFSEDKPCKAELREELIQQRGSDNIRLQSITQDMREINRLTNEEAEKHAALLNKIWNACRYVRANFIDSKKKKKGGRKRSQRTMMIFRKESE